MVNKKELDICTAAVHGGSSADPIHGALLTPIVVSTAFKQPSVQDYLKSGYSYSRSGNPTVTALEHKIAEIEGAKMPAVTAGTGMAALHILLSSVLKTGDHVVITQCSYGGTNRASRVLYNKQYGIEFSYVDMTNLEAVEKAIQPGRTKMIFSETPCNPTLQLADLRALSDLAKKYSNPNPPKLVENLQDGDGPSRQCFEGRILHVTDTTLSPPPVMRGLDHGADIVLISLTKFYCGHNMYTGGACVTNEEALYLHMKFMQNVMGSILHASTAFGIMQTSKTLSVRVLKQCETARKLATHLEKHPAVERVNYPGLPTHPQHAIALKQHTPGLFGSMISFEVKGGTDMARAVLNNTKAPIVLAENLGAVESILTSPAVFTHGNMPRPARLAVGITDGLIRFSVGLEDCDELIKALDETLSVVKV